MKAVSKMSVQNKVKVVSIDMHRDLGAKAVQEDYVYCQVKDNFVIAFVCDGHQNKRCAEFVAKHLAHLFEVIPPLSSTLDYRYMHHIYMQLSLDWALEAIRIKEKAEGDWKNESESGTTISGSIIDLKTRKTLVFNLGDSGVSVIGQLKGIHFTSTRSQLSDAALRERIQAKTDYPCFLQEDGEWLLVSRDRSESINMIAAFGDLYSPGISECLDKRIQVNVFGIKSPSTVVLATDGILDVITVKELSEYIYEGKTAKQIIDIANTRDKGDNCGLILIKLIDNK